MYVNHLYRSADLKVNGFAEDVTSTDIVKIVVEHFASENVKVLSVQQCPGKIARVTFHDRAASDMIRLRGELEMGGVKVAVVPPPPPPPNWVNVNVYGLPYDAPCSYVEDALKFFGKIQEVRFQRYTHLPDVATGTRIVRIDLKRSIPRFVKIHSYRCKIWYRGQPTYCDICKESTHLAFNCPFKGKCLACGKAGHFARKCPDICFNCKGSHASDSCPNRRGWERASHVDEDVQSVASNVEAVGGGADGEATVTPEVVNVEVTAPDVTVSNTATSHVSAASGLLQPSFDDLRLNQLDEYQTQSEVSQSQQLGSVDNPQSQSVLANLSNVVNDACEAVFRVPDVPAISSVSAGSPLSQDSDMADPSAARKRDLSPSLNSRSRSRKQSRPPGSHVPSGVVAAASLARARSSSGARSGSRSRSSSFNS